MDGHVAIGRGCAPPCASEVERSATGNFESASYDCWCAIRRWCVVERFIARSDGASGPRGPAPEPARPATVESVVAGGDLRRELDSSSRLPIVPGSMREGE